MNINKIVIISFFLTFCTGFVIIPNIMEGYEIAKMLFFHILVAISISIFSFIHFFKTELLKIELNCIDFLILFYYFYIFLRTIYCSADFVETNYFITIDLLICFYFFCKNHIKNNYNYKSFKLLTAIFLIPCIIQLIICLLQLYGLLNSFNDYFILTGTFGNLEALVGYFTTTLPFAISIYLLSIKNKTLEKNISLILIILSLLIIPATLMRNVWISIIISTSYVIFIKYRIRIAVYFYDKKKIFYFTLFILFCIIYIFYGLYYFKPDSANGRILIWKISLNILNHNPIFGIGITRYKIEYPNHQSEYFSNNSDNQYEKYLADNINHTDNEYLQILIESGIIGITLFIGIIILSLRTKSSELDIFLVSIKSSLISLYAFMFFANPLKVLPIAINFFFFLGIISSFNSSRLNIRIPKIIFRTFLFIMLVSCIFILYNAFQSYTIYKKWHDSVKLVLSGDSDRAMSNFQELYPSLTNNGQFLHNYGGLLGQMGKHELAIKIMDHAKNLYYDPNLLISLGNCYSSLGNFNLAEKNYFQAYYTVPSRIYPLYLLTKLYYKSGDKNKFTEMAVRVLQFKEKIPSDAVNEMKLEVKKLLDSK